MISKPFFLAPLVPDVLNDKKLSLRDRTILSAIIRLAKLTGYCFATNKYIAENLNCSVATVSASINKLKKSGYITHNYPNPKDGGRVYHRVVRKDLFFKPAINPDESSLQNTRKQPSIKSKHTYVLKKKNNINNEFSARREKQIVDQQLKVMFPNKMDYYESIKLNFNKEFTILWDEDSVSALVALCNSLDKTYRGRLIKIKSENRSKAAIEIFELLIKCKPVFFRDSQPKTFLKFLNSVITQERFLYNLEQILSDRSKKGF
jgi:hypothetical protein